MTETAKHIPLVRDLSELWHRTAGLTEEMIRLSVEAQAESRGGKLTIEDTVDVAFLLKGIADKLDSARKEANRANELVQTVGVALWAMNAPMDGTAPRIRGQVASGTPDGKPEAALPERGTAEYEKLLRWLGCPQEMIDRDLARPHWPHVQDRIAELVSQGSPLPPGVDPGRTRTRWRLARLRPISEE
jgi:hypothetical protein